MVTVFYLNTTRALINFKFYLTWRWFEPELEWDHIILQVIAHDAPRPLNIS